MDQLFIKITLAHTKIILGVVYLLPKFHTQAFLEYVNCVETLFNKYSDHKFILVGDYNLPRVLWSSNSPLQYNLMAYIDPPQRENADVICNAYSALNLVQNLAPHPNKDYTLDLLFTPAGLVTPLDLHEQLLPTDIHHLSTFCEIQDVNSTNFSPTTFKRNFRNADYESIITTL